MNKSFRNTRSGALPGPMPAIGAGPSFRPRAFALAIASAFAIPIAAAQTVLPTGPSVANGAASFQQSGSTLTVTNAPGTIINWKSFSMQNSTVQFVQQNAASQVFNFDTGKGPSVIGAGANLLSNGQVFLINPNGITIGAGARIDVAGFLASSLGISSADLLAGKFKFVGGPGNGNVVNQGTIVTQSGGFVYFIGKDVQNSGVIHTPQGQILLAAGSSVEIINPRSPDVRVEISADANEAVNLGKLVASGGTIGMYAGNVRQKGVISASTAEVNAQGKIMLVAKKDVEIAAGSRTEANGPNGGSITIQAQTGTATVAGTVEAKGTSTPVLETGLPTYDAGGIAAQNVITVTPSAAGNGQQAGAAQPVFVTAAPVAVPPPSAPAATVPEAAPTLKGGEIQILGETVRLTGNASIDASGELGGGTILIGGDYQGANAAVQNSLHTYVESGVYLRADATVVGDGGKVIVWAEEDTHFVGSLSAQGGLNGGNGGLGETSGKLYLYFRPAYVSLAARRSGYNAGSLLLDPGDIILTRVNTTAGDDSTGGAIPGGGTYDPASAGTSTADIDGIEAILNGGTSVTIKTSSGTGGSGNITLAAGQNITKTAANSVSLTLQADGAILLDSGSSISATAGTLGVNLSAAAAITVNGSITTNGGAVAMVTSASNIGLGASINTGAGALSMTTTGAGNITQTSGVLTAGGVFTVKTGTGTITLGQNNVLSGAINLTGGNATLVNTGAVNLGGANLTGGLSVTSGTGGISQSGTLVVGGTATFAAGSANNITLLDSANDFATVKFTTGNNVRVTDANSLDLGASTVSGTLGVNTTGAITQSGVVTAAGTTTLAAGSGNNITLGNTSNNFSTVIITSGNDVTLADTNAIDLGASTVSGNLSVTASGAITQSGTLSVNGVGKSATFAAGSANNITLLDGANDFTTVRFTSGNNVQVTDANALDLGASTVSGNLNVFASGTITQSGTLGVNGVGKSATFAAGSANNITLLDGANDFTTVKFTSGNNVQVTDANALDLGASTVSGTLGVNTTGAITQSGVVAVTGSTTLAAGSANNITLGNTSNNFSTVVITSGNDVTLADTNAIDLGASTVSGNLSVTAVGAITQSGTLSVNGVGKSATFAAGSANNITLLDGANDFTTVKFTSGNNVQVTDANALDLGASTVSGTLGVNTTGAITQSGIVAVTGTTTLAAGSGNNITLGNGANNFSTVVISSGNDVTLADTNAIDLGASTVSGNLSVTAVGAITQSGTLSVNGVGKSATFAAGSVNNITLLDGANDFTIVKFTSGNNIQVTDANALDLGASTVSGTLGINTTGVITQSGALSVTGVATFAAGSGNDITLNNGSNNFSTFTVTSGNNVQVADANALILGASTVSGTLGVSTNGAITQSGVLTVTGAATFAAGAGNDITLANGSNNFSTVVITSGNNVTLADTNALILGASTMSGTLGVTANGAITQSGVLNVTGAATFAAGSGNDITLNNGSNNFSTVGITSGNNVSLADANALILGASTVSGTLGVTTNGAITQSGAVVVSGTTTLTAGSANNITLGNGANNFATVVVTSGNDVTLGDTNGIDLGASTVSGNLSVTAVGAITQSGTLSVNGVGKSATFAAGSANNITLLDSANDFTNVKFTSGNNVQVTDANALDLGASTVSGTLAVNTTGAITQSGAVAVTGTTTLAAGAANNITLGNGANNFSTVVISSGNNVTLADTNAIDLGASTVSGTLGVTSNGAITQSGVLTVTGPATFAAGAANNITLSNGANVFSSSVAFGSGNDVSLVDNSPVDLGASTISGNLNVSANGAITQSGVLIANGAGKTASFTAGSGNNITLANSSNDFTTVRIISGADVSLADANALDLGASTVSGILAVNTAGAITQSGALSVTGITTLAAGVANDITLGNGANNFSTVAITSGRNVQITDANALILGASTVSGTLGVNTSGAITQSGALGVTGTTTLAAGAANNITLTNGANNFSTVAVASGNNVQLTDANAVDLGTSTISGALLVNSAGAITQSGAVQVAGITTLNSGSGNNITLGNAANNFSTVIVTSGNDVSLTNAGALDLGASTIVGNLTVSAGGAITQSGTLSVNGAGKTATFAAGAANNITLTDGANDFTTIKFATGNNVQVTDANALDLGASTVSGTLGVTASGAITQSGVLTVSGITTLAASGANNITLGNASNNFSTVVVTSGNNVTLADTNAIDLGTSTVSGTLGVTSNGAITQSGVLTVTGAATFAAGSGNDITLGNTSNNFSTVGITSGNNVTLADTNALILGASTVSGTLGVTTNGAITQSGILNVTGAATFAAGAGNDITLNNGSNNFSTVGVTSANNVSLADTNALILGASTVSGTLGVTTNGAITQSGAVVVTGTTTLAAGSANNITLGNGANNFSTVVITSGNNVTLADTNGIDLGASTVSGTLGVTANGAITQSGILNVTGAATFAAGSGNDITLGNTSNNFSTVGITSGNNVTLADTNALILGASTVSGALGVTTNGAITQSGILNVTGAATFAAGSGNNITLSNTSNNFSTVGITSGNNVTLADTNALILGASTVSGTLGVTTNGAITQSGILNVTGAATFAAGSGNDISLGNTSNNFSTVGITSGNNVTLADTNALILGASTVSGTLGVTTNGAITQSGILNVTGAATFAAGSGNDITLNNGSNNFSTVGITSGNNVSLADTNALILGASTISGTLGVTTNGAITQSGALTVTGTTTLAAGAGNNITLSNASNDFSSMVITSGNNVSLADTNALVLGTSTVSGTLNVSTAGAITQSGALVVTGATTLSAGGANDITLTNAGNNFSSVSVTSGNNVSLTDGNAITLGNITETGALVVAATGTTLAGDINTTGGLVDLTGAGAITLGANVQIATGNGAATGGNVNFGSNAINADIANSRTLSINAQGASAGGTIFLSNVGATTALGGLGLDAAATQLGGATLRSAGLTTIKGAATNLSGTSLNLALDGLDLQGTLNVSGKNLFLTTLSHTGTIALGGADGSGVLGISSAEFSRISNVAAMTIGDALQTGAINVSSATDLTPTGATSVNLVNKIGGINFGADLTVNSAATLNVTANAGGATTGAISAIGGGSLFGPTAMNFTAATGIGASGAPVKIGNTGSTTIAASNTTSGGIYIQTVGTLDVDTAGINSSATAANGGAVNLKTTAGGVNFHSGGVNAGDGNISIASAGKVDQSLGNTGLVTTGTLTVRTYSDNSAPGTTADINLANDTASGNNVGGGVLLETHLASNTSAFSNASITYKSFGGTNLSGFGTTGDVTLTAASFTFLNSQPLIGRNVSVKSTSGDITMQSDLPNTIINSGVTGGTLTLDSAANINIDGQIGASSAQPIVVGSVANVSAFNHQLVLKAVNNINVTKSIYLTGDLNFQAGGAVNIRNLAASTKPLVINAANISFGDSAHRVASVNIAALGDANVAGQDRSVLVQSAGSLGVYTVGNFTLQGGTASASSALAAAAIGGTNVTFDVGGTLGVYGGTASNGGASSALVQATTAKVVVVGDNLIIKGGNVSGSGNAEAIFDPAGPLSIVAGHNIVLQSGTGPSSGATLANAGAINMQVNAAGSSPYTYGSGSYAGLVIIGPSGSGLVNIDPILGRYTYNLADGGLPPPITLTGGTYHLVLDGALGGSSIIIANVPLPVNPDLAQQIRSTNIGTQVNGLIETSKEKKLQDDGCNN